MNVSMITEAQWDMLNVCNFRDIILFDYNY